MKKKPAAKKDEALPAIRLKPGTWVAMDGNGQWYQYITRPHASDMRWVGGYFSFFPLKMVVGLPKVPKSQWNKHLYRVGTSGELIRVEVK
jgi:hypothetical protein